MTDEHEDHDSGHAGHDGNDSGHDAHDAHDDRADQADQEVITAYADAFERRLAGPRGERSRARAELVAHLSDAAASGELGEAMKRLGDPAAAAAVFTRDHPARPAPLGVRVNAALIDNLPLLSVTVALFVHDLTRLLSRPQLPDEWSLGLIFPPLLMVETGGGCVGALPFSCGSGLYQDAGLLYELGVPLTLAWSFVGLALFEARTGTTPGKRLCGLRVVGVDGLRIPVWAALVRRAGFLLGPLAWFDWLPALWGRRRRLLEQVARTEVVTAGEAKTAGAEASAGTAAGAGADAG